MKKLAKRFGIVLLIAGVLYLTYFIIIKPNGFVSETAVALSFAENINDEDVCDEHFNTETISICTTFILQLEGHETVFKEAKRDIYGTEVIFTVDGIDIPFDITFSTTKPEGIRARFNDEYYLIDTIR